MQSSEVETRVFIGIGSNLEPRLQHLQEGVKGLKDFAEIVKLSAVYESDPIGFTDQPPFLNAVVEVTTDKRPFDLLASLKQLEQRLGRAERPRWHEREIDFDILFYGDLKLLGSSLVIPHPEAHRRSFVLKPLADLDSNFVHPVFGRTVSDLLVDIGETGIHRTDQKLD